MSERDRSGGTPATVDAGIRPPTGRGRMPALQWLLTPLLARHVARELVREHPLASVEQIAARMRADLGAHPDPAGLRLVEAVIRRLPAARAVATPHPGVTNPARGWRSPTALALIAANLLPLYGVLALGWEVFALVLLFWLENVVIGVLYVARMLCADPGDVALWLFKLVLVPFFCVHYGMFTAIHGVFVFSLFGDGRFESAADGLWLLDAAVRAVRALGLGPACVALAASHAFSFGWNYLRGGEFRGASPQQLMGQPYGRVVVLHLAIIGGGFAVIALGSPVWALVVLLVLKIAFDLKAHLREHRPLPP